MAMWMAVVKIVLLALTVSCKKTSPKGAEVKSDPAEHSISRHPLEIPADADGGRQAQAEKLVIGALIENIGRQITNRRDAHPKAHGCVKDVTVRIRNDLDRNYRRGVFAGTKYQGMIRFSSGASDPEADDRKPGTHGFALKILLPAELQAKIPDIPGEAIVPFLERRHYKSFDIITINGAEEFLVNDLASYKPFFTATAMAKARTQEMMTAGNSPAEIAAAVANIFGTEYIANVPPRLQPVVGALLAKISAYQTQDLLTETYSSWVPYAFDQSRGVKYQFRPCPSRGDGRPSTAPATPGPNFLGERLRASLTGGACYQLWAQFHEPGMPSVEDAALGWGPPETRKYVHLADLDLPPRFTSDRVCEALSFNPAHALPDQQGIGAIQRARRLIYAAIARLRNR